LPHKLGGLNQNEVNLNRNDRRIEMRIEMKTEMKTGMKNKVKTTVLAALIGFQMTAISPQRAEAGYFIAGSPLHGIAACTIFGFVTFGLGFLVYPFCILDGEAQSISGEDFMEHLTDNGYSNQEAQSIYDELKTWSEIYQGQIHSHEDLQDAIENYPFSDDARDFARDFERDFGDTQ